MSKIDHQAIGIELFEAMQARKTIAPLTETHPEITINDAYKISRAFLDQRCDVNGEKLVGKKIGVTSKAVQDMLGVFQPDFGFLTDAMWNRSGKIDSGDYIALRAEAEIAFVLSKPLKGPGVTGKEVIAATEYILPCFEIVDSRIRDWQIKIEDTIADNASCGTFVLGETGGNANKLDLANLEVVVHKNGKELSRGFGSAVQDGPENAVAWLANTLGVYDIPLDSSEIILSGSLVPLEPVKPGDEMQMHIDGLGDCSVSFI